MKTSVLFLLLSVSLIGCSGQNLNKNPSNGGGGGEEIVNDIELVRHNQRVVRLGCDGVVKSDKIETVKAPIETVEITPDSYDGIYSSSFFNRMTNSSPSVVGYTTFNIDYSYGFFNMHVIRGRNVIDYKFKRCVEWSGGAEPVCKKTEVYEEGYVVINVGYTESFLDGVRTIDECSNGN